jgi:hypothetical protein
MRALYVAAALFWLLVLAAPAAAQKSSDMPAELWSEYPLVQKVERAQSTAQSAGEPSAIGPLLPPTDPEAVPAPGESTRWGVWLAALALGFFALLLVARTVPPVAASGIRVVGGGARRIRVRAPRRAPTRKPIRLRRPDHFPRAPASRRRTQHAPLPPVSVAEPEVEREPRRYVVRRSGFLRSRFIVVADNPGGKVSRLARSRSFWRVGDVARRERSADDAWYELVNELRAGGWEPSTQRSDFWVPLRHIDNGPSSFLPTIEAYTHAEQSDET